MVKRKGIINLSTIKKSMMRGNTIRGRREKDTINTKSS
jgi:hypothetical protein